MQQVPVKRMNHARNNEKSENEAIQDILDRNPLFPCKLYEIEYVKIIRELINIHPATVYLVFKIATSEVAEEIIKFPIPIYRAKRNWHTALKHFKRMEIVDYKDIEIHSIEPHKALFTPFGRFVVEKWENSPLFKAFEVLDTLNFTSTNHYESIFNNNFIAYKDRKGNVFYSETQKIYHKYSLISRTKTKSSIKISVDSGFSDNKYDYYIEESVYNKLVNDDSTIPIKLKESRLAIYIQLNFRNHNFEISVLYDDDFTEHSFDVQKSIDLTDIIVERRKSKIYFKNLNVIKNNTQKKKKVNVSQSAGSQTSKRREERTDFEVVQPQQTEFRGSFKASLISEDKRTEVKQSIENRIKEYQAQERELRRINQEIEQQCLERQVERREHFRQLQLKAEREEKFKSFIISTYEENIDQFIENPYAKLESKYLQRIISENFSNFCDQLSSEDAEFYSNMFEQYLDEDFKEDFIDFEGKIKEERKKREIRIKKLYLNFFRSFEDSKEISEIKAENIEDINSNKKSIALERYIIVIRYFLFLTLVLLFIYILILGFNGINNAWFPPSSTAKSFKYLCLTVYVLLSVFIAAYLISILYNFVLNLNLN